MSAARGLLVAHIVALVFGLIGMLVMIPNPWLWSGSPLLTSVFAASMEYAGALHIWLGAAVMLVYGLATVGPARTAIFFVASCAISLGFELLGTGTGWPFGAYEYTAGLGAKVLDRVPYTIPLSWFYMGFCSYLLASTILAQARAPRLGLSSVLFGGWLLMAWDLVLDPAMAHDSLPLKFWVWHQTGFYFGMPLQNLLGWIATGLAFMAVSRLLWQGDVRPGQAPAMIPFAVYVANVIWAMALSASVGLWGPILLATALGIAPALVALRDRLVLPGQGTPLPGPSGVSA
ncbi:MAG: carotenoid biosynthesis protein [Chloroflexi bacterium]|nr:carotenoid biosynthesis protein [Chloroflexota bacterium]